MDNYRKIHFCSDIMSYCHKTFKTLDTLNNNTNCPKYGNIWIYKAVVLPNDADVMEISVYVDQNALSRAF